MLIGADRKNQKRRKKKKKKKKRKGKETFKDKRRSVLVLITVSFPARFPMDNYNYEQLAGEKACQYSVEHAVLVFPKGIDKWPRCGSHVFKLALLPILVIKIFWRFMPPPPPSTPFRGCGDRRSPIGRPGTIRENVFISRWTEANSGDVMRKRYLDVRENNRDYTVSLESLSLWVWFFSRFSLLFVRLFVCWGREREEDDIVRMMVSFRVEFGSVGEFNWDKC